MSKFQVAKNMFGDLADEEEDYNDYYKPQTNSSSTEQKSDFKPGAVRQPMTYTQIFEKAIKGNDLTSLNDLANILDESLRIRQDERTLYCDKYETYDKFNQEEYEKLLDKRASCFETRNNDQDFINTVILRIPKEIKIEDIKSLIDSTVDKLSRKKPTGHGSLFLIDLLFQYRPEIFNQLDEEERRKLFFVDHKDIPHAGPPTLWLLSRAILKPSKVKFTTNELISIFINELLNTSEVSISGPYSVWASYIIERHFNETKDNKLSAHNYTELIPLRLRLRGVPHTNRDQHMKNVLFNIFNTFQISDTKNYAREIILHYPDFENAPREVKLEFVDYAKKSPSFIKGWGNCHNDSNIHDASVIYLQQISQIVPSVLDEFPENVVASCNNDIAELKMKDKKLFGTSIRFMIVIAMVAAGFFLKKYEVL